MWWQAHFGQTILENTRNCHVRCFSHQVSPEHRLARNWSLRTVTVTTMKNPAGISKMLTEPGAPPKLPLLGWGFEFWNFLLPNRRAPVGGSILSYEGLSKQRSARNGGGANDPTQAKEAWVGHPASSKGSLSWGARHILSPFRVTSIIALFVKMGYS